MQFKQCGINLKTYCITLAVQQRRFLKHSYPLMKFDMSYTKLSTSTYFIELNDRYRIKTWFQNCQMIYMFMCITNIFIDLHIVINMVDVDNIAINPDHHDIQLKFNHWKVPFMHYRTLKIVKMTSFLYP